MKALRLARHPEGELVQTSAQPAANWAREGELRPIRIGLERRGTVKCLASCSYRALEYGALF